MGAHGKVILKSDQKNSILDVLSDVCKLSRKESNSAATLVESSPRGESQSNIIAERAVQDLEGVRTHQLDLETTFAFRGWWRTWWTLSTRFRIGHDGRSA